MLNIFFKYFQSLSSFFYRRIQRMSDVQFAHLLVLTIMFAHCLFCCIYMISDLTDDQGRIYVPEMIHL